MTGEPATEATTLPEEERARARAYALLGRLFYAAPDEPLLAEIRGQARAALPDDGQRLGLAWRRLVEAAGMARLLTVAEEYDALFGGVGKALVPPYTSHYIRDNAPDKHLVALRETLAALGMMRRNTAFEIEDHAAAICDAMRLLIEQDQPLDIQKTFFAQFVLPGMAPLCTAINAVEAAVFYRAVAELAHAFLELENAAFEMVDG